MNLADSATCHRKRTQRGISLAELIVVISILVILCALIVPLLRRSLRGGSEADCGLNLKKMADALYVYRSDNDGKGIVLDFRHHNPNSPYGEFAAMSSYLKSPNVLKCPLPPVHSWFTAAYNYPTWPDRQLRDSINSLGTLRRPFVPQPGSVIVYCSNHLESTKEGPHSDDDGKYIVVREDDSIDRIDSSRVHKTHCQETGCSDANRSGTVHIVFPGESPNIVLER